MSHYRPVSNLPVLAKIIDLRRPSITKPQITLRTMTSFQPFNPPTVATAITRIHNDILCAVDESMGVLLLLLDFSAAFDAIDHAVLFERLHDIGIRDSTLAWSESYMSGRH